MVVERLKIKKIVFDWVASTDHTGSIVASIPLDSLSEMGEACPKKMHKHFLVMHFFNPVRYMRLLELVSEYDTLPEVTAAISDYERVLKGIVTAKDTPNFIANRIGTYGMCSIFGHMERLGLSVEAVDAVFGPAIRQPKSAVFRTCDLVGLDTLAHVIQTVYNGCENDREVSGSCSSTRSRGQRTSWRKERRRFLQKPKWTEKEPFSQWTSKPARVPAQGSL